MRDISVKTAGIGTNLPFKPADFNGRFRRERSFWVASAHASERERLVETGLAALKQQNEMNSPSFISVY